MRRFVSFAAAALLVAGVVWGAGLRVSPLVTSPGGTTIIIGVDGGTTYTGTAPIDVTGSVISCLPADDSSSGGTTQGGCITSGTQYIPGTKVWPNYQQITGTLARQYTFTGETFYSSMLLQSGLQLNGPIAPTLDNNQVRVLNSKLSDDVGNGFVVDSYYYRDAGRYFAINNGAPCQNQPLLTLSASGDLAIYGAPDNTCADSADILNRGAFTDGTGASGHVMMKSYPKHYITVRGDLAANHDAVLADGGRPVADGGYWIQTESDGGTYFPYAGLHGGLTVITPENQYGGWLFQLINGTGGAAGQPTKFYVDAYGGIGQNHQLALSNFPACPGFGFVSSLGQFSYGAATGVLMSDTTSGRWYQCTSTGWSMMAQSEAVLMPPVLVNAALTVSTLGGFVMPGTGAANFSALQFYVGASGTGGTTDATIRISDGTHQCDFNFACNISRGPKRITGTGAGCSQFTSGAVVNMTVQGIGDCSVGPTLTGNATVEGLWR